MGNRFGDLVRLARIEKGWSQRELARRIKKSPTYVHYVERGLNPSSKTTKMQVGADAVDTLARTLGINIDEARLAAGYAPANTGKPQTVQEFIEALDRLGVPGLEFMGHYNGLHEMSPDDFVKLLDDIRLVVDLSLRRMEKQ